MFRPRLDSLAARAPKLARAATLAIAAWSVFACLYVMFGRVAYPYDLEWMSGSILDHVERVQQGLPIYVKPSAGWIPFLYPPLYYWLGAALSKILPTLYACRVISIAAVFVQAACVWRLARRHGATRFWGAVAIGLFFACFEQSDFWYDLERPDSLFVAMAMVAAVLLDEVEGIAGAVVAGLLLGLAFFAKQPASVFLAGGAVALAMRREWARAVAFIACFAGVVIPMVVHLDRATDGWFSYYVLKMPTRHGITWSLLAPVLGFDLPHAFVLLLATLGMILAFAWRRRREDAVFVGFLGAGLAASVVSRLHIGGWFNVLMFWMSFAAAAVGIYGARIEAYLREHPVSPRQALQSLALAGVPALAFWQMWNHTYVPADHIPVRASISRFRALVDDVRDLEKAGEVLAVGRGHLTTARHFHIAALIDVLTVEHKFPDGVLRAFRDRRFAAILIDSFDDLTIPLHPEVKEELFKAVTANYYVARRLDGRVMPPIVGWGARPTWVLLPRDVPLDEDDRWLLNRRSFAELGIASMREDALEQGAKFPTAVEGTEPIARDEVGRAFEGVVDPVDGGE